MHIWLGVENFAKMESARVCINQYTLLVGHNNSGKTFLMQLIQGLSGKLVDLLDEEQLDILCVERVPQYSKFVVSSENISQVAEFINKKLSLEKENIVKEIFGKEIPIERLYVDISMEDNVTYEIFISESSQENIEYLKKKQGFGFLETLFPQMANNRTMKFYVVNRKENGCTNVDFQSLFLTGSKTRISLLSRALSSVLESKSLFLPASRTGLLLLYRDFFANKADDTISYRIQNEKIVEGKERRGGLTRPVYEFLRFLQTYSEDESLTEMNQEDLLFFERNLIEGQINVNEQGVISYHSDFGDNSIPMYLASSMINEIAPLALAITDQHYYERLVIDEIEASLHPQKQMELVRFLNRLYNHGMKLIISTHSDTFVSKLNNLYLLSQKAILAQGNITEQIGLEEEDLIDGEKLFVYEFINQPNGKSIVKEIKGNRDTGYQFDLFTGSAMQLYDEALKIGEIQKNE